MILFRGFLFVLVSMCNLVMCTFVAPKTKNIAIKQRVANCRCTLVEVLQSDFVHTLLSCLWDCVFRLKVLDIVASGIVKHKDFCPCFFLWRSAFDTFLSSWNERKCEGTWVRVVKRRLSHHKWNFICTNNDSPADQIFSFQFGHIFSLSNFFFSNFMISRNFEFAFWRTFKKNKI